MLERVAARMRERFGVRAMKADAFREMLLDGAPQQWPDAWTSRYPPGNGYGIWLIPTHRDALDRMAQARTQRLKSNWSASDAARWLIERKM